MKISELVKQLNKYKREYGDVDVVVDQLKCREAYDGEEFKFEAVATGIVKMPIINMDTGKISRKHFNHVTIYPEFCD